jgi:hypothetical protein
MADIWHKLMMEVLGYDKYAAAGCDYGSRITSQLGQRREARRALARANVPTRVITTHGRLKAG